MNFFIYKIQNKLDNKLYVGKTRNIKERWKKHLYIVKKGETHPSYSYIHRAINKYGIDNFELILLEECNNEIIAFESEIKWIKEFKSNNSKFGYNLNEGGIGGLRPSMIVSEKMSISRKGKKHPLYGKKGELSPVYGKKYGKYKGFKKDRKGESNSRAILNYEQVKQIKEKYKTGNYTYKDLSEEYSVSKHNIAAIMQGKIWKNVENMTIGVIGCGGFVGNAICKGLEHVFTINGYDKFSKNNSTCSSIKELCCKSKIIFVCVPTPMHKNGSCDFSIVESVVEEIDPSCIIVVKSTVIPGTCDYLARKYKKKIIFSPEFLREESSIQDFKTQDNIILGGPKTARKIVSNIFKQAYPKAKIFETDNKIAEMTKYVINSFLAVKLSFFNEIYQICAKENIDYKELIDLVKLDKRIGDSHMQVPGHIPAGDGSGKFLSGWGGKCLPKDLNAIIYHAKQFGINPSVMEAAWNKNLELRPEKDWEKIPGVMSE